MANDNGFRDGESNDPSKLCIGLRGATGDFNSVRATDFIEKSTFIIASGNAQKTEENQRVLDWYAIDLYGGAEAVGGVDSEEDFSSYEKIVADKALKLHEEYDSKTSAEKNAVNRFLGVAEKSQVKILSEDRGADFDVKLRDHPLVSPLWDELRNHADPLVREAFDEDHPWPGKRFNEVRQACGGTIEFIDTLHVAGELLKENGVDYDATHTTHISYLYQGLKSDIPSEKLPEKDGEFKNISDDLRIRTNGDKVEVYIHKVQEGRRFASITPELKALSSGRVNPIEPDDVDIAPGTSRSLNQLWLDPESDYHDHHSLASKAIQELMAFLEIPKLSNPVRKKKVYKADATLLPSRHLTDFGKIKYMNFAGHKTAPGKRDIDHLGDFESAFENIGGAVFEPLPMINTGHAKEAREQTKRKILTVMGATYYATMANLGLPLSTGRPNVIHKSLIEPGGPLRFMRDLYAAGTVSKDPERMFTFYEDDSELKEVLQKGWDSRRYREAPERSSAVQGEEFMQAKGLGNNDRRYGLSFLGSSVCREQKINNSAFQVIYLASAAGMRIDHGFGTRGTMNQFIEGSVKAYLDGHQNFVNRGYRTPEIKKEGSSGPKLLDISARTGLQVNGDLDGDFIMLGDNFSVIVEPTLGGRQHLTCGQSHGCVYNKPGTGTVYEFFGDTFHNFLVEDRGVGMYEGFDNNHQKKLITLLNVDGSFDRILGMFDENEREMLGIENYTSPESAFQRHVENALELGLDISQDLQNEGNVKQYLQLAI
ncbi:MAG: hypothetical protein KTR28_07990 [Micavibrio sp.]|nr:hypothetical protein [Micavibrio sp.]